MIATYEVIATSDGARSVKVLDHGYLNFIELWGSDQGIVEAARMSTQKGFLGWGVRYDCPIHGKGNQPVCCEGGRRVEGDEKLLRYLYEHKHSTPFEMSGMTIEIQAPIFVFREWQRHRTQSYSEMSARYEPLPDVNYIPSIERLMMNASGSNKQAGTVKGAVSLEIAYAEEFRRRLARIYEEDEALYQYALKMGVPKELARIHLPVGRYSRMRASANLRNWLGFLTLRLDPAAQWEIRQYAQQVGALIANAFPRTWELFAEGKS